MEHQGSLDDRDNPRDHIEEVTTQQMMTDTRGKATRSGGNIVPVQQFDGRAPTAQVTTPRRRSMPTR